MNLSFTNLPTDLEQFSTAFYKRCAAKYVVSGNKGCSLVGGPGSIGWIFGFYQTRSKHTHVTG